MSSSRLATQSLRISLGGAVALVRMACPQRPLRSIGRSIQSASMTLPSAMQSMPGAGMWAAGPLLHQMLKLITC
jgi:hypothetical protein